MKIYIDLAKQAMTKTSDEKVYEGDFYSNVFEVLFYNYENENWFPTMSQLAPNGRSAGDFTADALGVGESHTYVEDGTTYLRFTFTMGATWVLMKGRSEFYIWFNRIGGSIVQKKCVGKVNVMIDQSTDNYFIADPLFNPAVKTYIDSCIDEQNEVIAQLGTGQPSYLAPAATIEAETENKGLAVATDTGIIYVWDTTLSTPAYVSSGLQYSQWPTAVYHSGNQLQDSVGNDFYPNIADGCVTQEKLDNDLFDDLLLKETTDITSSFTLQNRYLDKANGNANPDSNSRCTDFIDLSQYGEFFISGFSQYATTLICTYDENKTFLRYYCDGGSAGVTYTDYDFIPQSDEKYAKFGTYQYTTHPLIIKSVEVIGKAENKTPNYLYKKKYVACGDSFTKGDVIASNKVYPYLIAERNKMTLVNMSANGSYAHNGADGFTNSSNSYYYQNIPLDADYITIAYGLNETSTTIGTKDSNDNTTIWGAYNEILTWIITNIPNAKVGIISNDAWMTYELRNALQEIASYYGVSFLDLKEYGKPMMISGKYTEDGDVNSTIKNLRTNQYCVSNLNGHPNELGHRVRSYIIENFLRGMDDTDNRYTKKEVDTKLTAKQNTLTFDNTPTESSTNPVTSGGVYNAINGAKTYTDNAINELRWELGSHTLDVTTDTDTKYLKSVPNYTIGCQINKVGGMSYKDNLIALQDVAETTSSGITYSVSNGIITLNGTASAEVSISFSISLSLSGTYTLSAFNTFTIANSLFLITTEGNKSVSLNTTNKSNSFTFSSATASQLIIWIPSGTVFNDDMFSPMLVSGSTAPTTYKPYGILDSAVTSVVSRKVGLNSLRLTQIGAVDLGTLTWEYRSTEQKFKSQQISGMKSGGVVYCTKYAYDGNTGFDAQTMNNMTIRSHNASPLVYIKDTNYTNATTFKNSLNGVYLFYELATELATPQQAVIDNLVKDTLSINASIQNLTGYGWGVNNTCYNYIDFVNKKFVKNVGRIDLNTLSWNYANGRMEAYLNSIKDYSSRNTNLLCANYNSSIVGNDKDIFTVYKQIIIYDSAYTDATAFKNAMSGVYLYYELATPVETDISAYLTTDTIDVEPLGTLEFTNTYSQDVPSDIDYLIEEVKA